MLEPLSLEMNSQAGSARSEKTATLIGSSEVDQFSQNGSASELADEPSIHKTYQQGKRPDPLAQIAQNPHHQA